MTDSKRSKWEKMKAMGRNRYVLVYGLLLWGVVLTIVTSVLQVLLSMNVQDAEPLTVTFIAARFTVFAVFGFFIASARWLSMERKYGDVRQ
ncbi:hypothetical protein ACFFK0_23550 [Paenibacillus chartarius]|uniref:DUF3923 domain-containing protein n=1 Tax=Paenibacillus chartarius TaxID=747481 RepID=A0ABV6DRV2_9BACL